MNFILHPKSGNSRNRKHAENLFQVREVAKKIEIENDQKEENGDVKTQKKEDTKTDGNEALNDDSDEPPEGLTNKQRKRWIEERKEEKAKEKKIIKEVL